MLFFHGSSGPSGGTVNVGTASAIGAATGIGARTAAAVAAASAVGTAIAASASSEFAQDFVGPFDTSAGTTALGGNFATYESRFASFEQDHWDGDGAQWDGGGAQAGYDPAKIHYIWYERTGDADYLTRANAFVLDYRASFGSEHNPSEPWRQWPGLALHYLYTGDATTLAAIGNAADRASYQQDSGFLADYTLSSNGTRWQAHALQAVLAAWKTNAPSDGIEDIPGGWDWDTVLPLILDDIVNTQHATGYWEYTDPSAFIYHYPYQWGLLTDALITYYHAFDADSRIPLAIKKCMDYLWTNIRDMGGGVTENTFFYIPQNNGSGETRSTTEGAPDLVMWEANAMGFLYYYYGDVTYKTRGDALFAAGMAGDGEGNGGGAFLSGWKQFQEAYTASYRYPYYREATPLNTPLVPVNSVVPVITGTAQSGQTLTCGNGTWSNTPTSRNYQWKRYTLSPNTTNLATNVGSDQSTYVVQAGDVGKKIYCVQTANNASGASAPVPTTLTATVT